LFECKKKKELIKMYKTVKEVRNSKSSPNIVKVFQLRRMTWRKLVTSAIYRRSVYRILDIKSKGKRPLGKFKGLIRDRHV
jgi:hypothetical protein